MKYILLLRKNVSSRIRNAFLSSFPTLPLILALNDQKNSNITQMTFNQTNLKELMLIENLNAQEKHLT